MTGFVPSETIRWEYAITYVFEIGDEQGIIDNLNGWGSQGWEIVDINKHGRVILKRPYRSDEELRGGIYEKKEAQ